MEEELRGRVAKAAHKAINHSSDLFWSVLDELPANRRDVNTSHILSSATTYPKTVHTGYGEMTYPALDKLLLWLCRGAPSSVRLSSDSCFLDLGSGFGKCVIHARLQAQVRRAVGIEYVPLRHSKASDALLYLSKGKVPGFVDKQQLLPYLCQHDMLSGVELIQGNIVDEQHSHHIDSATHILAFDVLFGDALMRCIVGQVRCSKSCRLYLSYHCPTRMMRLDFGWRCIHQVRTRTTGKQQFTCYVYINPARPPIDDEHVLESTLEMVDSTSVEDALSSKDALSSAEHASTVPTASPFAEASELSDISMLCGEDVPPDDDHRRCFCIYCGRHCSPNGQGSKRRQHITAAWKKRIEASGGVHWTKSDKTAIHVGCRTKVWKTIQQRTRMMNA
jgi:hypothetical protein